MYKAANGTSGRVMVACRAIFSGKINDLQMQFVPKALWKNPLEIVFGLLYCFASGEPPAFSTTVDMSVNRKCLLPKGLTHHYRGRFMSYSRERLKFFKRCGHF